MRNFQLIFIFTFCLFSCKDNSSNIISKNLYKSIDSITFIDITSYYDYRQFVYKNNPSYLEICTIDSIKASIDIKRNQYIFFDGYKNRLFPSQKDLPNFIKEKYGIKTIELLPNCIVNDSTDYTYCYEKMMHKGIETKYGNNFLEKSKRIVDSIYCLQNINKVHKMEDSYALFKREISDEHQKFHRSITEGFKKHIVFPKDYKLKNDSITNVSTHFIINKNGKIDSLEIYSHGIEKKFESSVKKLVKQYILNNKWRAVELYGIKLNTKENFFIYM